MVSKGYRISEKSFGLFFFLSFKEESFKAKVAVHKIKPREQLLTLIVNILTLLFPALDSFYKLHRAEAMC